jgi:thiol:disulfide interchange protein DsbD
MSLHRKRKDFQLVAQVLALLLVGLPSVSRAEDKMTASAEGLVRASLVAENASLQRGRTGWLGVHLTMKEGWHTYWRNPGDAGLATSIKWTLPAGVTANPLVWPQPDRFVARSIVGYGYSGEVALLTGVNVPSEFAADRVKVDAIVSWLACASVCIPGSEKLTIALPVSGAAPKRDARNARLFAQVRRRIPQPAPFQATFSMDSEQIRLSFPSTALPESAKASATFYPFDNSVMEHGAPQPLVIRAGRVELRLQRSAVSSDNLLTLDGLLVVEDAAQPGTAARALDVSARRADR